jgi:hypothetical protein
MSRALGLTQGLVPFRTGMAPQGEAVEVVEMAQPAADNFDRARAAYALTGGNNVINSEADIRRQTLLALQRDAQRNAAMEQGRWAVEQLKGQQAAEAYRAANDRNNGVVDGVAYRNGQPVGYVGTVPGMAPGIPAGGFNPAERQRFNQQLMALATQQGPQMTVPMQSPQSALATGALAGATAPTQVGQVPEIVVANAAPVAPAIPRSMQGIWDRLPQTPQGLPDDRPGTVARVSRESRGILPQGGTIAERQQSQANTERGKAAREDLGKFEAQLPTILSEVSAEQGLAVDEDILADTLLAEAAAAEQQGLGKGTLTPSMPKGPGIGLTLAQRLKLDPKALVRWAQDYKKGKAARR